MAKYIFALLFLLQATQARADFWGGDLIYLARIFQNSIYQLEQLRSITNAGKETTNILREANRGVNQALYLQQTINHNLKAGTFSDISNMKEMILTVKNLYGSIPKTSQSKLQKKTDLTVAESFKLHNEAFKYAKAVDKEASKMKRYAHRASQAGATKTLLEGQAVMIHTLNQILRTNAALLKIQTQGLALKNKDAKNQARQFQVQYKQLGNAFKKLKPNYSLHSL